MAGGGIEPGVHYDATDELANKVAANPATMLHCLGMHHTRLAYRLQGRDYRITDVHGAFIEPLVG